MRWMEEWWFEEVCSLFFMSVFLAGLNSDWVVPIAYLLWLSEERYGSTFCYQKRDCERGQCPCVLHVISSLTSSVDRKFCRGHVYWRLELFLDGVADIPDKIDARYFELLWVLSKSIGCRDWEKTAQGKRCNISQEADSRSTIKFYSKSYLARFEKKNYDLENAHRPIICSGVSITSIWISLEQTLRESPYTITTKFIPRLNRKNKHPR